ncbi:MAG: ABC transporter permease subunit [Bacillota bacterium]
MNIFLREIKSNLKSLIIWSISFGFLIIAGMVKFAGTSADPKLLQDVISQIPTFLKALFGFGTFDISTLIGYYGIVNFYIILMAAVHASFVAAHTISKEEQEKTSEFLMVKPISRNSVITSKLLAVFVNVVIINVVSTLISIATVSALDSSKNYSTTILGMMTMMFAIQIIFLFIGSAVATLSSKPKFAAARAMMLLVFFYFLSSIIDLFSDLTNLKYFTPFKFFSPVDIINNKPVDVLIVVYSILIVISLALLTFKGYEKRDLNV